jgi:hypothetical protein
MQWKIPPLSRPIMETHRCGRNLDAQMLNRTLLKTSILAPALGQRTGVQTTIRSPRKNRSAAMSEARFVKTK